VQATEAPAAPSALLAHGTLEATAAHAGGTHAAAHGGCTSFRLSVLIEYVVYQNSSTCSFSMMGGEEP
jgi:hypothetical protein